MKNLKPLFLNTIGRSSLRILVLIASGLFFGFLFVRTASCSGGMLGCGMTEFSLVSPFYILLAPFIETFSFTSYLILFIVSASVYSALLYSMASWVEGYVARTHQRAVFTLKKI